MSGKLPTQTYQDIDENKIPIEYLRNKLKLKQLEAKTKFAKKFPHAEKFFQERGLEVGKLRHHSAKIIGAGALTGSLLLGQAENAGNLPPPSEIAEKFRAQTRAQAFGLPQEALVNSLASILPERSRSLTREEEKKIEQILFTALGIKARAALEGEHLNTTYGLIGAEQHLRRYPGDTLGYHGSGDVLDEGIAPGLGAWGYFSNSRPNMTADIVEKEKWYAVAQTLYLPDWNSRQPYLQNWYKYRKVLIVNTQNGNAVVADIADSGPAAWTGKHFGGSPEVMDYLGGPRYKKGQVIFFFVDDPQNRIPLGPVEYNNISIPASAIQNI
jgi:hypothetical protein